MLILRYKGFPSSYPITLDVVRGICVRNFPGWNHIKCKESEEAYPDEGLESREVCALL